MEVDLFHIMETWHSQVHLQEDYREDISPSFREETRQFY